MLGPVEHGGGVVGGVVLIRQSRGQGGEKMSVSRALSGKTATGVDFARVCQVRRDGRMGLQESISGDIGGWIFFIHRFLSKTRFLKGSKWHFGCHSAASGIWLRS